MPEKSNVNAPRRPVAKQEVVEEDDEILSELDNADSDEDDNESDSGIKLPTPRKSKRKHDDDDLEAAYMQKLVREEDRDQEIAQEKQRNKRVKRLHDDEHSDTSSENGLDQNLDDIDQLSREDVSMADDISSPPPQHETLAPSKGETELEKASRTVFLGNVSTSTITSKSDQKTLKSHLSSFTTILPTAEPPHRLESLRFRSTAFSTSVPKRAAFAKKELMGTTTKSTNAYAVYSTKTAAREAAKQLNGSIVLGRHLRVDQVSHPAKVDHHRCVFVGGLAYVDDESQIIAAEDEHRKKPKKSIPGDVEEGLWQHFGKAGTVESVRVVRDPKTRVGKGFAYVQFTDENGVEAALLYNDKKFPPLLPRKLRVVRAKKFKRNGEGPSKDNMNRSHERRQPMRMKPSTEETTLKGRVTKLLGRAGAALSKSGTFKRPESFIFEGHRASNSQGNRGLKLGGKGNGKKKAKPTNRSAKRGTAWKSKSRT